MSEAAAQVWCYIARLSVATEYNPAGTVIAATVDEPRMAKDNAQYVADWMRAGCTIERVPVEWARKHLFTTEVYRP